MRIGKKVIGHHGQIHGRDVSSCEDEDKTFLIQAINSLLLRWEVTIYQFLKDGIAGDFLSDTTCIIFYDFYDVRPSFLHNKSGDE